jgi:hypothetical protein
MGANIFPPISGQVIHRRSNVPRFHRIRQHGWGLSFCDLKICLKHCGFSFGTSQIGGLTVDAPAPGGSDGRKQTSPQTNLTIPRFDLIACETG